MYTPPEPNQGQYDSPGAVGADFDLDEPNAMDTAKDIAGNAGDLLKKHWWKALIAIVLLGIVFFALDFFVFSIKTVSFSVKDTEGSAINGVGIKIFDASGTEAGRINANQPISLRRGNYTASVTASGYKQKTGVDVTVQDDSEPVSVKMEKDWDIELEVNDFPSKLVEGQKTGFFATIKNNSAEQQNIDLVFEGAIDNKYMSASYPKIVAVPGDTRVFIEMNVKEELQSSLIKDALKGTVRVKGLDNPKAKKTVEFDLSEFDRRDLRVSGSAKFSRVREGETAGPKNITINNRLDFPVQDVQFEVNIQGVQFSTPSQVEQWFSFNRELPIKTIPAGGSVTVGVLANVPVGIPFTGSATEETVSGKLFVKTSFWQEEVELSLTAEKSEVELGFSGISANNSVRFDSDIGGYPADSKILTISNKGELPIKLVNLSASCNTSANWIPSNIVSFDQSLFEEIPAKEQKQTTYTIKIPNAAKNGDEVRCNLRANYDDPRGGTNRLQTDFPFIITIS